MYNHKQYAKILFDVCEQSNCINEILKELKSVAYLYAKVPAFRLVLITKRLNNKDKIDIISKTLISFDTLVVEFLSIIISNNHSNKILDIISKFYHLVNTHSYIKEVELTTATSLDEKDLTLLTEELETYLKRKPKINAKTDPKIIGGIKLRIGNRIFDNSVNYQIKQLEKTLHNM